MQYIDTVINMKQNNFMFDHHNRNNLQKSKSRLLSNVKETWSLRYNKYQHLT